MVIVTTCSRSTWNENSGCFSLRYLYVSPAVERLSCAMVHRRARARCSHALCKHHVGKTAGNLNSVPVEVYIIPLLLPLFRLLKTYMGNLPFAVTPWHIFPVKV